MAWSMRLFPAENCKLQMNMMPVGPTGTIKVKVLQVPETFKCIIMLNVCKIRKEVHQWKSLSKSVSQLFYYRGVGRGGSDGLDEPPFQW